MTPWRNGSASDSRSEGCVFESRRGQRQLLHFSINILDMLIQFFYKTDNLITKPHDTARITDTLLLGLKYALLV